MCYTALLLFCSCTFGIKIQILLHYYLPTVVVLNNDGLMIRLDYIARNINYGNKGDGVVNTFVTHSEISS